MIRYTLKEFIELFSESAHPELQEILKKPHDHYNISKAKLVASKTKELIKRGESTGVEDKMPKGSSRAYIKETTPTPIKVDGQDTHMHTGYKVAVRAELDKYHDHKEHDGSLGQMQMRAENGDHFLNEHYRMLTHKKDNHFESNTELGIFPPLMDHDHETHSWSHVAHVDNMTGPKFKEITKTATHPKGITHTEFCDALHRSWNQDNGRYWKTGEHNEKRLDHIEQHPLVQKFLDHQRNFHMPPHDYQQKGNMGIWTHPVTGEQHIVARDHGFNSDAVKAYENARKKKWSTPRGWSRAND